MFQGRSKHMGRLGLGPTTFSSPQKYDLLLNEALNAHVQCVHAYTGGGVDA